MTHDEAVAALADVDSFPSLLAAIHAARFTGKLTISFYCGAPDSVELPVPAPPPARIPLRKRRPAPKRGLTPAPSIPHATG